MTKPHLIASIAGAVVVGACAALVAVQAWMIAGLREDVDAQKAAIVQIVTFISQAASAPAAM